MLENIHVKNFALIRDCELNLKEHLNILSGETGAGKSILLGSVNLALGSRADSDLIRSGADHAYVELVFSEEDPEILKKLAELDVYPEEGRIIISRRISGGKSTGRINGETVTLARLKEVSSLLIDIHGQHEHQSLLNEENHRKVLDDYGKEQLKDVKDAYLAVYRSYRQKKEEIRKMGGDDEERKRRIDFLSYELSEIEESHVKPGEEEQITAEYRRLTSAREIEAGLSEISETLAEDVSSGISACVRAANGLIQFDPSMKEVLEQLLEIESLLQDAERDAKDRLSDMDSDGEKLQLLEERLELLNRLKKKYGGSEEMILKTADRLQHEYDELVTFDENKERILEELSEEKHKLIRAAKALTAARAEAAKSFDAVMTEALKDLNFLDVRFETAVTESNRYTSDGADEVSFMISTNPGEPVRPLTRVASGGELSRIMLAIRTLTAGADSIHTLIFDEIDTGISGNTAKAVADKMNEIAGERQVICISHLPQIVAMADHHFLIEKHVEDGETVTSITELDEQGSVREVARLLGAGMLTDTSIENAREMKKILKKQEN